MNSSHGDDDADLARPTAPEPDGPASEGPDCIQLDGGARSLFEALAEIKQDLANMYLGALDIAARPGNPDNLALAAHGMRELIEKLPRYLDVPVEAPKTQGLLARVRELTDAWFHLGDKAVDDDKLTGHGRKLLAALGKFCEGVAADFPSRKKQTATVLRSLDPHPIKLPPPIETLHVQEWGKIEGFFIGVAHHTRTCTEDEFQQYVRALERFLVERLRPRTFDDFAAIDDLLGGGS